MAHQYQRGKDYTFDDGAPPVNTQAYNVNIPKRHAYDIQRSPKMLTAQQGDYGWKKNKIIKWIIANDAIYDFREAYFLMTIRPLTTGGTYKRLQNFTGSFFDKFLIKANGKKIEERSRCGEIDALQWHFFQDADVANNLAELVGYGTTLQRDAWGAGAKQYVVPFNLGLLQAAPFPANTITDILELELHIGDPNTYFESDGSNFDIEFTSLELHCHTLHDQISVGISKPSFEADYRNMVLQGQWKVIYDSVGVFQTPISNSKQDLIIGHRAKALKTYLSFYANTTDRNNPLVNHKMQTFLHLQTNRYQGKVNGVFIPDQHVSATVGSYEAFLAYLRLAKSWGLSGYPSNKQDSAKINIQAFYTDSFLMITDVKASNHCDSENVINNVSTYDYNADSQLQIIADVPFPPNTSVITHAIFKTVAQCVVKAVGSSYSVSLWADE